MSATNALRLDQTFSPSRPFAVRMLNVMTSIGTGTATLEPPPMATAMATNSDATIATRSRCLPASRSCTMFAFPSHARHRGRPSHQSMTSVDAGAV